MAAARRRRLSRSTFREPAKPYPVAGVAFAYNAIFVTLLAQQLREAVRRPASRISDLWVGTIWEAVLVRGYVVGKLGLSATEIGFQIGASAMEVNYLLKDQGFFYGEPGAYDLTSKGEKFGVQRSHDNGYGGSTRRSWETSHFDPSITDVLDSAPEKLAKARADVSADRQAQKPTRMVAQVEADANFRESEANKKAGETQGEIDLLKVLLVVASGLAMCVITVGARKCVRWYRRNKAEKAVQAAEAVQAESSRGLATGTGTGTGTETK